MLYQSNDEDAILFTTDAKFTAQNREVNLDKKIVVIGNT
jgi:hypothetical protein